jgi:hypothetical protein
MRRNGLRFTDPPAPVGCAGPPDNAGRSGLYFIIGQGGDRPRLHTEGPVGKVRMPVALYLCN